MAANEASRLNFARNCRDLIVEYDFDGIDIDWEYPGYADHGGTPGDASNFNLLLADVRAALDDLGAATDRTYGLTAALPCGPSNIDNVDVAAVSMYLSELNLMTYGAFMFFRSSFIPPPFRCCVRPHPITSHRNSDDKHDGKRTTTHHAPRPPPRRFPRLVGRDRRGEFASARSIVGSRTRMESGRLREQLGGVGCAAREDERGSRLLRQELQGGDGAGGGPRRGGRFGLAARRGFAPVLCEFREGKREKRTR